MNDTDLAQPKSFIFLVRARGDIKVWDNDYTNKSSYLGVRCNYSQNSSTIRDERTMVLCQVSIHPLKNGQSPCQQLTIHIWRLTITCMWMNYQPCKGAEFFQLTESLSEYQILLLFSENMLYFFMVGKLDIHI